MRADIFCRVVDNYGDIGVCWRLARRLARFRAGGRACGSTTCGPSPASSRAGPGTGAPAMPGHRHHPLDAGAARRPDARRRGDRGLRLRSARRLPGCHAPGPSGLDQPGIPERRSLDRKLSRPAVATARRAGQAFLLSRFHSGHGRTAARARPVRRTRRAAGFARTTGVRAARWACRSTRCRAGATALASCPCFAIRTRRSTHWPRPWPPIRARPCCWRPKAWRPAWKRPAPRRAARPGQAALRQPAGLRPPAVVRRPELRARRGFLRAGRLGRASAGLADLPAARPVHLDKLEAWLARYPATEGARALIRAWNQPTARKPLVRPWPPPWRPRPGRPGPGPPVTGTQPRPTGPIWRKIWPHFAQSWPRNARIESFLRSPDAIGPQNTDASRGVHKIENPREIRIRPPDDGDGGPESTRR